MRCDEAADVLPVADRLVEEPRRDDDEEREHQNAVKEIHERTYNRSEYNARI